jgi:hypothetical protein
MISLIDITKKINNLLGNKYTLYTDASLYFEPTREGNDVKSSIIGISTLISSSIVPVDGLSIGTETIGFELLIPVDTRVMEDTTEGIEEVIKPYKADIDSLVSTPNTLTFDNYVCTLKGTLAEVGEVQQKPNVGVAVSLSFTITLNYFANGVNSLNEQLFLLEKKENIEYETRIPFTSLSFGRTVVQDGGAFSDTEGVAKNYIQSTALSIELLMPALSDNKFCELFREFLFNGESAPFTIRYKGVMNKDYRVVFLTSNEQVQGIENVGYTITLAEALEVQNE